MIAMHLPVFLENWKASTRRPSMKFLPFLYAKKSGGIPLPEKWWLGDLILSCLDAAYFLIQ